MTDLLWLFSGIVLGAVLAALGVSLWLSRRHGSLASNLAADLAASDARADAVDARTIEAENRLAESKEEFDASVVARDAAVQAAEEARIATTRVEGDLKAAREKHDEHARGLEEARKRFEETFEALGVKALKENNDQFVKLAKAHFETAQEKIGGDLGKRQEQLESLLKPMKESITKQQETLQKLEVNRVEAFTGIEEQMKAISEGNKSLRDETGKLVTALRRPEQRGKWGEMHLRNVVEMAGMTDRCDFSEQVTVTTEDQEILRPDLVVHLPGGGTIVVDSKVALDAHLDASSCDDDQERRVLMARHANAVEGHAMQLADKKYWKQFERSPKAVVMYMPIESGLYGALDQKPDLHAKAMRSDVLIATPTTLLALLRSVAYGWQQEDVAINAREIANAGAVLYDRLRTFTSHLTRVGDRLRQGTEDYNKAVGSLESSILPAARKMKELGTTSAEEVSTPVTIEIEPRNVIKDELLLPPGEEIEAAS